MADPAAVKVIEQRYQTLLAVLAAKVRDGVARLWDIYGGITDTDQARFSELAASLVEAGQRQAAALADAYIRTYTAELGVAPAAPLDTSTLVALRGVPTVDVYARPTVTLRTVLSNGGTYPDALAAARARAAAAADTDVKLAARRSSSLSLVRNGFQHYRRVPDGTACTFCLTACTQRYNSADLMPLHDNCGCTVAPYTGGAVVDPDLLARLKAASGRDDYWNDPKAAIAVRQHGELGPVITRKGDHFTGPAGLAA